MLLAVKSSSFHSVHEIVEEECKLELVTVELTTNSRTKLCICCCYRPPNSDRNSLNLFDSYLAILSTCYDNIVIYGDFNLPKIIWYSPDQTTGSDELQFTELLNDYFLSQVNNQPTRGENILDLIITSAPDQVKVNDILLPQESGIVTDHNCIFFEVKANVKAQTKQNRHVYDYLKGDFQGLRSTLHNIHLSNVVEISTNVNVAWLQWKAKFVCAVREFIPTRKIKGKSSPPWITGDILYMIRKKESVRRKLKHSSSTYLSAKFKQLRSMVKRMISDSRARFFESLEQDIKANPKRFWSIFKLGNKASSVPEQMSVPSSSKNTATGVTSVRKVVSSSVDIAEAFNQHFASVFSGDTEEPRPQLPTISCPVLQDISLSPCEVAAALRSLDVSKATGPDEISARLLKETAEQIAPSLTLLYNKSLETGVFPDEWKLANIVPIHKKDNEDHVENYRPISLLSIISKVLERCVLIRLRDHLLLMLDRAQHGFIPGKSCVTQLVEVIDYIGSLLDSGKQTDVIYLDMSKAFDKVQHSLILDKLRQYNISGNLLNWFTSYLRGRRQRVTVLGATSKERKVTSGVPQGSILGPMLFLLYVNDLPNTVNTSKVACFADDTKILKQVDNLQDTAGLQNDIISLNGWATDNGLTFNQMKC